MTPDEVYRPVAEPFTRLKYNRGGKWQRFPQPQTVTIWSGRPTLPGWEDRYCPHEHLTSADALECAQVEARRLASHHPATEDAE